jgi:hypothetical protein
LRDENLAVDPAKGEKGAEEGRSSDDMGAKSGGGRGVGCSSCEVSKMGVEGLGLWVGFGDWCDEEV